MSMMFSDCYELEEINLDNFNTNKTYNMVEMFFGCKKLINIDISRLNLRRAFNRKHIFSGCSQSLKQIIKSQNSNIKDIDFE